MRPAQVDLVITAGAIATMDATRRIIRDGAIAIAGSRIVAVGKRDEILATHAPAKLIERPGGLLTPGLIDCHHHPAGAFLISGVVDELPQLQRLKERVIPHEDQLTEDEAYVAASASFAELIRHGTTCFADAGGPRTAATARAALDLGIRGVLAAKSGDRSGPFGGEVPSAEACLAEADDIYDRFRGAGDGRLKVWYDLDLPQAVSDTLLEGVVERVSTRDTGIVGHFIGQPTDASRNPEIERYQRFGVFDQRVVLAHIGWLPEDDVKLLAASGASIAHAPSSSLMGGNGWVAHGVIPDLVAAGANLTLGTDAAAASRFLDLVRVMYLAATTHRDARRDPLIMGAHSVFEMATVNAAQALGWADEIGSIEPGRAADVVVFDATSLAWSPHRLANPIADLVYSGSGENADTVVINGRVVLEDKRLLTVDVEELAKEVDRVADTALDRLGHRPAPRWPME
ncbi:amidohydrolase family protein [Amycolatopsis rhabdoformis]|uniref:Amidohydrolase family protein n=1 Tax=Amycolatopsis rhabdoformis TaxID=1448059 RepID=A0ABZ1HX58_9PSEU|nr:amidohydrolase family protein [Amycolatopsis rhabdoformis]WSE26196.1 amidohydrolase family protein [Amycolatopsis rhabdoformis]